MSNNEEQFLSYIPDHEIYVWDGGFHTKDVPKAAGFWWHGGGCRDGCLACKAKIGRKWWSPHPSNALKIRDYGDEAVAASLQSLLDAQDLSRAATADVDLIAPDGLSYLPFQKAGIEYGLQKPGVLIGDEMGLGKTVQALGIVNNDSNLKRGIIFAPASLLINWKRESEKWLVRGVRTHVATTNSIPESGDDVDLLIINYAKMSTRKGKAWQKWMMDQKWDFVICDEAHYLKEESSSRTKRILGYYDRRKRVSVPGVVSEIPKRIFLTGTPIPNRTIEIQPLLGSLCPSVFGNFMSFAKRYAGAYHNGYGWDFRGASNLDELQTKMRAHVMVRRLKDDVLDDLPDKVRQIIPLPKEGFEKLLQEEKNQYSRAWEAETFSEFETWVGSLNIEDLSRMRSRFAEAKIPAIKTYIENQINSGVEKLVVFAHHRKVISDLREHWGDRCVSITGEHTAEERQAAVDAFQNDPEVKIFFGNLKAAGVGLTLTAASHVIMAEMDPVPANMFQAEDRCHRIGQKSTVFAQYLVIEGSLDEHFLNLVFHKDQLAQRALDVEHETPKITLSEEAVERDREEKRQSKENKARDLRQQFLAFIREQNNSETEPVPEPPSGDVEIRYEGRLDEIPF